MAQRLLSRRSASRVSFTATGNELNDKGPIHPCRIYTVIFTSDVRCISGPASHLDAENLAFLPRIITDVSSPQCMHAFSRVYARVSTQQVGDFSPDLLADPNDLVALRHCVTKSEVFARIGHFTNRCEKD